METFDFLSKIVMLGWLIFAGVMTLIRLIYTIFKPRFLNIKWATPTKTELLAYYLFFLLVVYFGIRSYIV